MLKTALGFPAHNLHAVVKKFAVSRDMGSNVGSAFPFALHFDADGLSCRRVMLKLSGEALQGGMGFGVDPKVSLLSLPLFFHAPNACHFQ